MVPDVRIGPNDDGDTFYSFLEFDFDYDLRDDRFNPRSGYRSIFGAKLSSEATGSEVNFYHVSLRQAALFEVSSDLVFAAQLEVSLTEPFGDTEVIPLSQRTFLGGQNSLRGFSFYEVGPRGTQNTVLGGDRSFLINNELFYDLTELVRGVVFLDLGQAILTNKGNFRGDGLDISDVRYSPGFGLHYTTPIGPLRAEYGFVLDRELEERFGRLNISIGTAF